MSTMDPARREELTRKYGLDAAPKPRNPIDRAIGDAERIVAGITPRGEDSGGMFDPAWSPTMYGIADRGHAELRVAMAKGAIKYVTTAGTTRRCPTSNLAVFVNFVGDNRIFVCKNRPETFATLLTYMQWWNDINSGCQIQVSDSCGGATTLIPLHRGRFLLLFECCGPCFEQSGQMADDGFICAEMGARAQAGLPL